MQVGVVVAVVPDRHHLVLGMAAVVVVVPVAVARETTTAAVATIRTTVVATINTTVRMMQLHLREAQMLPLHKTPKRMRMVQRCMMKNAAI